MRRARRLPQRLVRWTSLCVCLALALTSLVTVPARLVSGKGSIESTQGPSNQQTNGNARKVKAEPPQKGPPSATLPNLDEVKRNGSRRSDDVQAPLPQPSTLRSKRKPLGSRGGKKVGDPDTTGGSARYGNGSSSDRVFSARPAHERAARLHHARTKARTAAPPPVGDDQFIQNFFYWAFLHDPTSTEYVYWRDILRSAYAQGQTSRVFAGRELGMTLFESADYAARNRSNHDYVYDLYKTYLMRDPDQGGWDFWTSVVPSVGRENVRHAFDECGEFSGIMATLTPNGSVSSAVSSLSTARIDPNNQTGSQLLARDCEWGVGLLSLPGRAGLDLGLGLSYSSLVWTRSGPSDHPYLYFNEDNSSPSPGFRLGFATVQSKYFDAQVGRNVYMLITSSGNRVELRQVGTSNVYEAGDSSYLQLTDNGSSLLVRPTDGTQMTYQPFENEWYVTQIKDRNGNYLTVTYNSQSDLSTITDTLGRVINFNYDSYANLLSITQNWSGTWHTWASFGWGSSLTMQTGSFTGAAVVDTHNSEAIPVLRQVGFDDGSYYTFDYTGTAQVNMIRRYSYPDNLQRSATAYDYTQPADDCPRISAIRVTADNWTGLNGVPYEVVTQFDLPGDGSHRMIAPDLTVYKEFYGTGWQKGLVTQSEVWSGGLRQKWTTTAWIQDNMSSGVNYQTNPRVTETNINDSAFNRNRSTTSYTTFSLPSGASCSLPSDTYQYAADAFTMLRRTHTDYNLSSTYLNLRIVGLPAAQYLCDGSQGAVPCNDYSGASLQSKTSIQYDETGSIQNQGATTRHDDTNYGAGFLAGRANVTSTRRYDINNLSQYVTSSGIYNTAGGLVTSTDPSGHQNSLSYTDSFSDTVNRSTFAYPTTVTDADGNSSYVQYNYDFGAKTRVQGPPPASQSQGLIQTFTYDNAQRLQQATTTKNGAYQRYVYGPNYTQSYASVNNVADDSYAAQFFDGAGRIIFSTGTHPGSVGGYKAQQTQYDNMGRAVKVSNPTEVDSNRVPAGDDAGGGAGVQNVSWTNAVGVNVNGNNLTKTAADAWANAGAASTQSIASGDGYVETTVSETSTYRLIGLSHGDTNQNYDDIDFAIYPATGGTLYIYEGGTSRGTFGSYATGDVLRVAVEGGVVKYRKNGTLLYTSTITPTYPLLVDTSLYSNGSTLNNVVISGGGGSGGWTFTQQTYDWKGRPLETTHLTDGTQKYASYSACGCAGSEVVTLTDEVGRQQKIYSDVLGRTAKTEILQTVNNITSVYSTTANTYNARDQVTLVRQYQGADTSGVYQNTTMSYDGHGRLQSKHAPEQSAGTATTYVYNSDGTVYSVTDARGASATYTYNNRHLVTGITYSAPAGITPTSNVAFSYDAAGNRASMSDGFGSKTYSYNQLSQLMSEARTFNGVGTFTLSYDYNLAGELKKITDSTNVTINYNLDTVGQLNSVMGSDVLVGGVSTYASGLAYRAWGALKQVSIGGHTTSISYTSRMRVNNFNISDSVANENYDYYLDGRLSFSHNTIDHKFDRSFTYDHAGRLIEAFSGGAARGDAGPVPMYETFDYNAWNNTTFRYTQSWENEYSDGGSYVNNRHADWGYDADGRVTSIDTRSYAYDAAEQNISLIGQRWTPGGYVPSSTSSDFDGDGNRIREISNNSGTLTTTYYLQSTVFGAVVEELSSSGVKQTGYVYAPGGSVLATQTGTDYVTLKQLSPTGATQYNFPTNNPFGFRQEFDPAGATVPLFSHSPGHGGSPGEVPDGGGALDGRFGAMSNPGAGCTLDGIWVPCDMAYRALDSGAAVVAPQQTIRYSYTRQSFLFFRAFADGTQGWGNTPGWIPDSRPSGPPTLRTVSPEEAARRRAIVAEFGRSGFGDEDVDLTLSPDPQNTTPQAPERRLTLNEYKPIRAELVNALKSKKCRDFIDTLVRYNSGQYIDSQEEIPAFADYIYNSEDGGIFWATRKGYQVGKKIKIFPCCPDLYARTAAETLMHELIHGLQGPGADDWLDRDLRELHIVPMGRDGKPLPYPDGKNPDDWSLYWDKALKNACFPTLP